LSTDSVYRRQRTRLADAWAEAIRKHVRKGGEQNTAFDYESRLAGEHTNSKPL